MNKIESNTGSNIDKDTREKVENSVETTVNVNRVHSS